MKSIRNVLAGSLLAGGALLAAAAGMPLANADDAAAAPPPPRGMHGPGPHEFGPGEFFRQLNLTADQKASIKSIMVASKPQMQSMHEQMHANHLKLMQTKPDDPNYPTVVAEVAQSNAALASQHTTQAAELRTQMYQVLTPTQKTQLATLEAQWEASPHPRHWGHHGPGPDGAPPTPDT